MRLIRVLLLLAMALPALAQSKPVYDVYAIRYATIPGFPVAGLVAGAEPGRKLDIAMMIWLVRGNGRNILVDSGFYHERFFKDWHVTDFTKPSDTLKRLGLKPEDITDAIRLNGAWSEADLETWATELPMEVLDLLLADLEAARLEMKSRPAAKPEAPAAAPTEQAAS